MIGNLSNLKALADGLVSKLQPYELYICYVILGTMAVIPIFYGSKASVEQSKHQDAEKLSKSDAYLFPLYGSATLFSFYLLFKYFSKEYLNYLLTAYFSVIGIAALVKLADSCISRYLPKSFFVFEHSLVLSKKGDEAPVFSLEISLPGIVYSVLSTFFTGLYIWSKHWAANNVLGMAFSLSAISLIHLDSFITGFVLLVGLFFYDIFWVFKTEVMVTVAKSFDVPVKLLMPKALVEYHLARPIHQALLGLGDIVIPGVFIALCYRYDQQHNQGKARSSYFVNGLVAYVAGLVCTISVMHVFKAAQPALLYLSPACILSVLVTALLNGQLKEVFAYNADEEAARSSSAKKSSPKKRSPKSLISESDDSSEKDEVPKVKSTPRKRRQANQI